MLDFSMIALTGSLPSPAMSTGQMQLTAVQTGASSQTGMDANTRKAPGKQNHFEADLLASVVHLYHSGNMSTLANVTALTRSQIVICTMEASQAKGR